MTPATLALIGVRSGLLQPAQYVQYGQIGVFTYEVAPITQGTLQAGFEASRLGLEVWFPFVATGTEGFYDAGPGRLRGRAGFWIGRRSAWFLGFEGARAIHDGEQGVLAWGTRARDVLPGGEGLGVISWAHPKGVGGVRFAAGLDTSGLLSVVVLDLVGVVQAPVAERWRVVAELEVALDPAPMTLRPVARYTSGYLQVDLGLQLPAHALTWWTFQPLVQLRVAAPGTTPR